MELKMYNLYVYRVMVLVAVLLILITRWYNVHCLNVLVQFWTYWYNVHCLMLLKLTTPSPQPISILTHCRQRPTKTDSHISRRTTTFRCRLIISYRLSRTWCSASCFCKGGRRWCYWGFFIWRHVVVPKWFPATYRQTERVCQKCWWWSCWRGTIRRDFFLSKWFSSP